MALVRSIVAVGSALAFMTACAWAQADSQPATSTSQDSTATPSSSDEYIGPAILSRGQTPGQQTEAPVTFRPYIGVNGIYDTGLLPVAVNSAGTLPVTDAYGVEVNVGGYLYHMWKHTTLALDYRGNFRHYPALTYWDGTDQFLSLILTHKPTKHWTFTLREQGGLYSRNYFLSSTLGALDPNYLQLPLNDIYDNRVIFAGTSGDLIYQKSARLSFSFGGEGTVVRRESTALYGVSGAVARGDMEYRLSRHTTVGVDYHFTHYDYTKGFGNTNINSVGLNYSTRFTPTVQLSARVGGARVDNAALSVVALNPAVAALLGITTSIQAAYSLQYVPDIQVRLSDSVRRSNFAVTYLDSVVPGNGVYVTSRNNSGNASYSYSGIRYWHFGADATYGRLTTLEQNLGAYTSYGGGVGVTRELGKGLHVVVRLDARHYDISSGVQFAHTEYRTTLGLTYSPGDVPLALW